MTFLASALAVFSYYSSTMVDTVDLTKFAVRLNVSGEIMNVTWREHPECFITSATELTVQVNTSCPLIKERYDLIQQHKAETTNCTGTTCEVII